MRIIATPMAKSTTVDGSGSATRLKELEREGKQLRPDVAILLVDVNSYQWWDSRVKVVKVTSKGQVTIPIELRDALGIDEGTYLILVDTSAVYALIDRSDRWHSTAKAALDDIKKSRSAPVLTTFLVAECHARLLVRLGATLARSWLTSNVWSIQRVTAEDEAHANSIIAKYTDKSFSYADATSFAVMERLGIRKAFAFDPHFRQYGFQVVGLPPS